MKSIVLALWLSASIASAQAKAPARVLASIEVALSSFQFESLEEDLPARDLVLDPQGCVWIAGKRALWKWETGSERLHKVELFQNGADTNLELRFLAQDEAYLYVTADSVLFQIKRSSLDVRRYDTNVGNAKSLGVFVEGDRVFWVQSEGVFVLQAEAQVLKQIVGAETFLPPTRVIVLGDRQEVWGMEKNALRAVIWHPNGLVERRNIFSSKFPLVGIRKTRDSVFVHTRYSVLRFNLQGDIVQTIPVEGERQLVLMTQLVDRHAYLLSNRVLELYDIKEEKVRSYALEMGGVKQAHELQLNGSTVAMILDGRPRVFQLEGINKALAKP